MDLTPAQSVLNIHADRLLTISTNMSISAIRWSEIMSIYYLFSGFDKEQGFTAKIAAELRKDIKKH